MKRFLLAIFLTQMPLLAVAQPVNEGIPRTALGTLLPMMSGGKILSTEIPFGNQTGTVADGGTLNALSSNVGTLTGSGAGAALTYGMLGAPNGPAKLGANKAIPPSQAPSFLLGTAPQITNDSSQNYAVGSSYLNQNPYLPNKSVVYQAQDVTPGFAAWEPTPTSALPLDVIGLYVTGAAITTGGSGYAVGDAITLSGGVVVTVSTVSSGAITAVSITTPNMFACAPTGAEAALLTSGSGTGATFTLTYLRPIAYGTRLLSRCYSGAAMTVARSDTQEARAINFLSDGSLDVQTLDGFVAGSVSMLTAVVTSNVVSPRITTWNDQGGGGYNATQTYDKAPTISPARYIGNSRTVMFDAVGGTNNWHQVYSFLRIAGGLSLTPDNSTVVVLGGVSGQYNHPSFMNLGPGTYGAAPVVAIDYGTFGAGGGLEYANGGATTKSGAGSSFDGGSLLLGDSSSTGTVFDNGSYETSTSNVGSTTPVAFASTGPNVMGYLGYDGNGNATSGHVDEALAIIVPWSLTTSQKNNLEAAIDTQFSMPPQNNGLFVFLGDSHMDDWAQPFQQSWPRQFMALLNRPDIAMTDMAQAGQTAAFLTGSYWTNYVAPELVASSAPNKYVFLQMGYNDLRTTTVGLSGVEGFYQTGISEAHAVGAKAVCIEDVIRGFSAPGDITSGLTALQINTYMQQLGTWMGTQASGCDVVINFEQDPTFNSVAGPWPAPWFEPQDGYVHLTTAGSSLEAAIALKTMAPLLQ